MNVLMNRGSEAYNQLTEITISDHYFRHLYRIIKFVDKNKAFNDKPVGGIVFSARRWLLFQMVTFQSSRHGFLQSERRSFTR